MKIFPEFLWRFGIFSYLCHRQTYRERFAPGAVKDARVMTQGIFYAHILPRPARGLTTPIAVATQ